MPPASGDSTAVPPPLPTSPPEYPDLYGKRRELAKVQMLEREIGILEEELKSIEGLHPASRCCKEVADFVTVNADPLIHETQKRSKSCRFWKWLCGIPCPGFSWMCCSECPLHHLRFPQCCACKCNLCSCDAFNCNTCVKCSLPKCPSCSCPCCCCFKISCCRSCSIFQCLSCPARPRCRCECTCPKLHPCACCTNFWCNPCCLCY